MGLTTPYTRCHTTLWNINARKQAINDKFLGNVATYLRYGGDVNNQSKKVLLLSHVKTIGGFETDISVKKTITCNELRQIETILV